MTKTQKSPWPTQRVMQQIYDKHLWGGDRFDFYSGYGSHQTEIIRPYLIAVSSFLKSHKTPLAICDLGCGDFNIGKHLYKHSKTYNAIDIVASLIARNQLLFKAPNLSFSCMDISIAELPNADAVILRQVLQHLSNIEIKKIVHKLSQYKYIILTEHLPLGNFVSNIDIISGQGIRLRHNSGVDITEAPFGLNPSKAIILNEIILPNRKGNIRTNLYTT